MKGSIISWFASRYLLKKEASSFISLISWISIIGIMIAVGVLIVVLSVVNGFEKELESKLSFGYLLSITIWFTNSVATLNSQF